MNSTGQALVEMAIILPLLLLLVMGIFEFGRAMYIKNTLTQAARAGARTAVVTPLIAATRALHVTLDPVAIHSNLLIQFIKSGCTSLITELKNIDIGVEDI